jgi:hypothetical protein
MVLRDNTSASDVKLIRKFAFWLLQIGSAFR